MAKLPTVLGMGNKEIIVGKNKLSSGNCMLIVGDRKVYDWIEFTNKESMVRMRDCLNEAIEMWGDNNG